MNTAVQKPNGANPNIQLSAGSKQIRNYNLSYVHIGMSIKTHVNALFPRIGYLIFNLFTGRDCETRFMNYTDSVTSPNHLYISGLFSGSSLRVQLSGHGSGYAIKVHPVIGFHFLKIPMFELTDRQLRISNILDKQGSKLEKLERDYELYSFDQPHLLQFMRDLLPDKQVYQNDPIYHAVNTIIKNKGLISVDELAKQYCMSKRTLRRQFLIKVGLSPKAYSNIWKVHHAMELIQSNPKASLPEIAFQAGYYDVAHLANDFRKRLSLPPTKFDQEMTPLVQKYFRVEGGFIE